MPLPEILNLRQWKIFMQDHRLTFDVLEPLPRFFYQIDMKELVMKLRFMLGTTRKPEQEYLIKLFFMRIAAEVRRHTYSKKFEDIEDIIVNTTCRIYAFAVDPERHPIALDFFFKDLAGFVRRRTIEMLRRQKVMDKEEYDSENSEHEGASSVEPTPELALTVKQAIMSLKPHHRIIFEKYIVGIEDKEAADITLRSVNRIIAEIEDDFDDQFMKYAGGTFDFNETPVELILSVEDIIDVCLQAFYMDVDMRPEPSDVTRWCDAVPSLAADIKAHAEELLNLPAMPPEPGLEPALVRSLNEAAVRAGYWRRPPVSKPIPNARLRSAV